MRPMQKVLRFLKEVRVELGKVIWPTRARTARLSVIVVIVTAIFGSFIAAVDFGFNKGIEYTIDTQQADTPAPAAGEGQGVPNSQTVPLNPTQGGDAVPVPAGGQAPSVPAPNAPAPGQ